MAVPSQQMGGSKPPEMQKNNAVEPQRHREEREENAIEPQRRRDGRGQKRAF
jgi:hypothetical protein